MAIVDASHRRVTYTKKTETYDEETTNRYADGSPGNRNICTYNAFPFSEDTQHFVSDV